MFRNVLSFFIAIISLTYIQYKIKYYNINNINIKLNIVFSIHWYLLQQMSFTSCSHLLLDALRLVPIQN